MTDIHPTAIVERGAELAEDVVIGPFCHIGSTVVLGAGCRLESHVAIAGHTTLGAGCHVFPFAALGHAPQHLGYRGEPSTLVLGERNLVREHVTMHIGTQGGKMTTVVGNDCLFMAAIHVAHDCIIGNNVIMANNATLGGHVSIGDFAFVGGLSAIHQFVRIGQYAMVGGASGVENDVIPYGLVMGNRAHLTGLNNIGMKRRDVSREEIRQMRNAYRTLFEGEGAFADRLNEVAEVFADQPRVVEVVDFIQQHSRRDLCHPRAGDRLL